MLPSEALKVHFTTSRPPSTVQSRISFLDEAWLATVRDKSELPFPTQTWQLSSRIEILDGTLDGGLDVVKCTFTPAPF